MTPEDKAELQRWRRIAELDERAGSPVGRTLLDACNAIEELQRQCDQLDDRVTHLTAILDDPGVLAERLRRLTGGEPVELGDEDYTAAIEKLDTVYGRPATDLMELVEAARDEELIHFASEETGRCVEDCAGCLAERIADAITRTVNGGETS